MMDAVELAVAWSEEYRHAAEFVALQRWIRAEAEAVWDEVREVEAGSGTVPLLVVDERCFIGRRSLAVLREAVAAGGPAVAPRRLGDSGLRGLETIRTRRGMEAVEARVLAGEWAGPEGVAAPYPALLLSVAAAAAVAGNTAREILEREADGVAAAGLCHRFIDYYGEPRTDVLPYLDPAAGEILEIGCGRGVTGELLQERLGCRVTGVELNPVVAHAAARRLHRVVVGDVLEVNPGGPFDAVVATELFEHLVDQEVFLERLRRWVRPGGRVVLSVPNVGHWTLVEDLLAGRWDYLPIGLLCHTHFRFFTRRTLQDWLRAAGYEHFRIIAQETEAPPWLEDLPAGLDVDRESLATSGFYVIIEID